MFLVETAGMAYSINCNHSALLANQSIIWIQTVNKTNIFYIQQSDKVSANGDVLSFTSLRLIDEEFYACGIFDSNTNKLKIINSYYLYVRGWLLLYYSDI